MLNYVFFILAMHSLYLYWVINAKKYLYDFYNQLIAQSTFTLVCPLNCVKMIWKTTLH